jgi:RNA polymerase-binding transcription factor DksA
MDEWQYELAAKQEQRERDAGATAARAANAPQSHPNFDGEHCVDCGAVIPAARLALAKVRCVECQEAVDSVTNRERGMR